MLLNSVVSALLLHLIGALEVGEHCKPTAELSDGKCTLVDDCDVAVRALMENGWHPYNKCGFQKYEEVLCCPQTPIPKFDSSKAERECEKIITSEKVVPPRRLNIIGGDLASTGEFPHMVALGYLTDAGYRFKCGGSLISDRYVVTAAHCMNDRILPTIARMGVVDVTDKNFNSQSDIYIAQTVLHPDYKPPQKYNDIALIKLANIVQWNRDKYPACLYTEQKKPDIPLIITGWGIIDAAATQESDQLMKANVSLLPLENCSHAYETMPQMEHGISEGQLCAGDPNDKQDTCKGDSGGPLQGQTSTTDQFYRLVGITSFGHRSCGIGIPGIYTRITSYLDWIESVVWPD